MPYLNPPALGTAIHSRAVSIFLKALALAVVATATLSACGARAESPTCDKVAAANGSDSASGTADAPYRSAQKLSDSLVAGQTGCLRAGTYNEDVTVSHGGR